MLIKELVKVRHCPHTEDNRQWIAAVGHQHNRQAKNVERFPRSYNALESRVHHCRSQRHCKERIAAKLLGSCIRNHNWHKIHGCIAEEIQEHTQITFCRNKAGEGQQGIHDRDHTAADNGRQHRSKDTCQCIHYNIQRFLLFAVIRCRRIVFVCIQLADFHNNIIGKADILPNDDLELAALIADAHHALDSLYFSFVCFAVICQIETQTGRAMGQSRNILFAAYGFKNGFAHLLIILCHGVLLFFLSSQMQRQTAALQFCGFNALCLPD